MKQSRPTAHAYEIQRRATSEVLHDNPEIRALEVGAVVLGDEGAFALHESKSKSADKRHVPARES